MMKPCAGGPTNWTYYFNGPSIEAAKERIEKAGGAFTKEPHEVPGGMFVVQGTDPQNTAFALVGGKEGETTWRR